MTLIVDAATYVVAFFLFVAAPRGAFAKVADIAHER